MVFSSKNSPLWKTQNLERGGTGLGELDWSGCDLLS